MSPIAANRSAKYDYEILDTFEAGIVLTGPEVKSVRAGQMQLKGAFVQIRNGEAWLKNAFIARYAPAAQMDDTQTRRNRKLLLRHRELVRLQSKLDTEPLTIIPIRVYAVRNLLKVELALARKKKKYEKRAAIKKRELDREVREKVRG